MGYIFLWSGRVTENERKRALYEEGWNYLDSPEGKYRQNLEKNAEELRKKIIISVDINNIKC